MGGAPDSVVMKWREALARAGKETEPGGDLLVGVSIHLADSEDKAIAEATKFHEENTKMFAPLGMVGGLTDEQIEALGHRETAGTAGGPDVA